MKKKAQLPIVHGPRPGGLHQVQACTQNALRCCSCQELTYQGACSAMPTPTMNVQLLARAHAITTVISQSANGGVCCDAAIYDCQVQKVQLALCYAWVAVLSRSGQDLLCILDVRPVGRQTFQSKQLRQCDNQTETAVGHTMKWDLITSSLCLHATLTRGCSETPLLGGKQTLPCHARAEL